MWYLYTTRRLLVKNLNFTLRLSSQLYSSNYRILILYVRIETQDETSVIHVIEVIPVNRYTRVVTKLMNQRDNLIDQKLLSPYKWKIKNTNSFVCDVAYSNVIYLRYTINNELLKTPEEIDCYIKNIENPVVRLICILLLIAS